MSNHHRHSRESGNPEKPMSSFGLVKQFHAKFDPDPAAYKDLLGRRRELIEEEVHELFEAMEEAKGENTRANRAHLVKELCDVLYVTYGTLELLRVDADAAFAEVHRSNMSKTPLPGVKAQKLEGYQPANMEQFITTNDQRTTNNV